MKQFLTVVAVGVLGAFLLVACGGGNKPAETGGAGGAESAAPAAESAAPAASPAAS